MPIVLGLAAALSYGLSDFVAGLLSRRIHYAQVALVGNVVALIVTSLAFLLTIGGGPTPEALSWGAASGIGAALGSLLLYRGLARGRMGVVAPISAVTAAAIPVVIGVALGDRPSAAAWSGVLIAIAAIWLVSTSAGQPPGEEPGRRTSGAGVVDGVLAGVAFAALFVALKLAGNDSGLWPVVAGQTSSLLVLTIVLFGSDARRTSTGLDRPDLARAASVGIFGGAAVVLYFLSSQAGLLSIVAVLTSLYPAVPVLLATIVLRESISGRQFVGLVLAATSVLLILLG
jgi:drug/metabolite transporter (DMT)-like permease